MSTNRKESTMQVTTNNVPRLVIDAYELTATERANHDYLDWQRIDAGEDSATFFRYRGQLYDLGEFLASTDPALNGKWDGYMSETYFSSILVRYCEDMDHVIVGLALA